MRPAMTEGHSPAGKVETCPGKSSIRVETTAPGLGYIARHEIVERFAGERETVLSDVKLRRDDGQGIYTSAPGACGDRHDRFRGEGSSIYQRKSREQSEVDEHEVV